MKTLLITGSNGFIGSNVLNFFKNKYKIVALSRKEVVGCKWIQYRKNNLELVKKQIIECRPNYVIHCASIVHKNQKLRFKLNEKYYQVNVAFTKLLIDACVEVSAEKFLYLSSISVMKLTNKQLINEQIPNLDNINYDLYKFYKLECESLIKKNFIKTNVSWVILRLPLIYGKNAPGNLKLLRFAVDNHLPFLLEKDPAKRSFLGIQNLLSCLDKILISNIYNKTYVVADDQSLTFKECLILLSKARRKKLFFITLPNNIYRLIENIPILGVKLKILSNDKCYRIDNKLIKKDLKWEPIYNINDKFLDYFKS